MKRKLEIDTTDNTSDKHHGTSEHRLFLWRIGTFCFLGMLVWVAFFVADNLLPGIRSGSKQVYVRKLNTIAEAPILPKDKPVRVAVFGNSKVLAGFVPPLFDSFDDERVVSYNLGLPNATHFVEELETLIGRGQLPTHVLLTSVWGTTPLPSWREQLQDDDWMMETCFPFRRFPRNATLFLLRSTSRGGPYNYYCDVQRRLEDVVRDRGYHFIESQSHFPDHRLPDDFRVDSDDSTKRDCRAIVPEGPVFEKLISLMKTHHFKTIVVPYYVREGELAPGVTNHKGKETLRPFGLDIVGPEYWTLPNRLFSDPAHLNPEGARVYTSRLWGLLSKRFFSANPTGTTNPTGTGAKFTVRD